MLRISIGIRHDASAAEMPFILHLEQARGNSAEFLEEMIPIVS